ncbi:outer membrane lipoprotein-sorting protein [Suttonella sp. R2A3]|uniref:outer membrane lipoprotein-sorting protein n=1 Tax=Suttonella sp. R2A3 TaxID=2908648 RepID=UPI001F3039A6|nr:outer membrane lipoprotein-sorting protein [Suttonella sp. R2A3]UJF23874.1 outer membrane lipoprotein-sorting protein [Suttonella sp. R2A3]
MFQTKKLLSAIALLGLSASLWAQSADEIIKKANLAAVYPGDDGRTEARMMIVDGQGRKQMRQFHILRRNVSKGGDQQYLVVFSQPADVARTTFLVNKHPGRDDDRWLYLPGLDLVKRITAGDKRTSFVGSTFFYEDISGRDTAADSYSIEQDSGDSWLLKAVPKAKNAVEFAYFTVKIDKNNYLPVEATYYDNSGEAYRRISASKIETIQGYPTITQMKAENLRDGSYTLNQMRGIKYDVGIPADIFSERSLRMPPSEWLK